MLIDLHAHTKRISKCCKADIETVINESLCKGINGVVLTNHFQKSYFSNASEEELVKAYIQEYYEFSEFEKEVFKIHFLF